MPPNHLVLCHPLLLLLSIFPSIRVLSNELALCIRWPENWSFSLSISPSNEYSGLISFTIDWFDLLAVQGTLKSPLQKHSSKASILQCSAFFIVQLSHNYWKNHSFDYMGKLRNTLKFTVKQHRPTKRLRFTLCYITGTNIVLWVNHASKKEIRFVVTRGRGLGEGELEKENQKHKLSVIR